MGGAKEEHALGMSRVGEIEQQMEVDWLSLLILVLILRKVFMKKIQYLKTPAPPLVESNGTAISVSRVCSTCKILYRTLLLSTALYCSALYSTVLCSSL